MKRNNNRKEATEIRRYKDENDKLKRQVSSLRKQLARIDLDRFVHVRNMLEEHLEENESNDDRSLLESLKKEWACRECDTGHLEITIFNKVQEMYYYRKCNNCDHRTKSQKYDKSKVKGILRKQAE